MAFDFPTGVPDGYRVINPETGSEYAWQADPGKWVLINPQATNFYVEKTGDEMTGPLILHNSTLLPAPIDVVLPSQAAHKKYVDDSIFDVIDDLGNLEGNTKKVGVFKFDGDAGSLGIAEWQFEGRTTPDYDYVGNHKFNISKTDMAGNDWTVDDFPVGAVVTIQDEGDRDYLKCQVVASVDGGPAAIQVDYSIIEAQGDASDTQIISVGEDIWVDVTGDTMTGDLIMKDAAIVFIDGGVNGDFMVAERLPGEEPNLIKLEHPTGAQPGSYDLRIMGNTSYNAFRITGKLEGDQPLFEMRADGDALMYTPLSMEGNVITGLGPAINDDEAVSHGQLMQELEEFKNEILDNAGAGIWTLNNASGIPAGEGKFVTLKASSIETDATQLDQIQFHQTDYDGDPGNFNWEVGDLITLKPLSDITQELKYRVNAEPRPNNEIYNVDVKFLSGTTILNENADYSVLVTRLDGIDADELDERYVLATGDTMTGALAIEPETNNVAAVLSLMGERSNLTNSAATVLFQNRSNTTNPGQLEFHSSGTSAYFRFNQNVEFRGNDVREVGHLKFGATGAKIEVTNREMVSFRTPTSSTSTASIYIPRYGDNRRALDIQGREANGTLGTLLRVFNNSSGGDAINYYGITSNTSNIMNRGAISDLIDNKISSISSPGTNISISRNTTSATVQSSTGSNGTINSASSSFAGVMTAAEHNKLSGMSYKISYSSGNYFIESA